jgi:hypothetical protein
VRYNKAIDRLVVVLADSCDPYPTDDEMNAKRNHCIEMSMINSDEQWQMMWWISCWYQLSTW